MFRMMKLVGDAILLIGCIVLANGGRVIASDPELSRHLEMVVRAGMLPVDVYLAGGGIMLFEGLVIIGFGQILYALAHIAEKYPRGSVVN